MITLTTLFIALYLYSIFKIKRDSGSWERFHYYMGNDFFYIFWFLGTVLISCAIGLGILYLILRYDILKYIP